MKKLIIIFSSTILTTFFISCKSGNDNVVGDWTKCNKFGSNFCSITKQGNILNLHMTESRADIVLEKKSDGIFTGAGGMVTVRYDESTKHLMLSAMGEDAVELCK